MPTATAEPSSESADISSFICRACLGCYAGAVQIDVGETWSPPPCENCGRSDAWVPLWNLARERIRARMTTVLDSLARHDPGPVTTTIASELGILIDALGRMEDR